MKKQDGWVLIAILIFFQVLALLGCYALTINRLEVKMINNDWIRQKQMREAERFLAEIENQLDREMPKCLVPMQDFSINKSLSWWQSGIACKNENLNYFYYYFFESLGEDSCAAIESLKTSGDYIRISLLSLNPVNGMNLRLQTTVIQPHQGAISSCHDASHRVTIGRQMWRSLN